MVTKKSSKNSMLLTKFCLIKKREISMTSMVKTVSKRVAVEVAGWMTCYHKCLVVVLAEDQVVHRNLRRANL